MSVSVGRLLASLQERIPPHKAADWDVSGLQLGDPDAPVGTLAVCHEVTEAVVEAIEAGPPGLLLTYHPLLFKPTNRLVAGATPGGRAIRLIKAGTALAVAHTSFDAARGGTADALATALGLLDATGFGPVNPPAQVVVTTFVPPDRVEDVAAAMAAAGGGRIGNYGACSFRAEGVGAFTPLSGADPTAGVIGVDSRELEVRLEMVAPEGRADAVVAALASAHPYEEPAFNISDVRANLGFIGRIGSSTGDLRRLVETAGAVFGASGLRVSSSGRSPVRVAVVPGSGSSFVGVAASAGADVLVTGDVGHHLAREAIDRGMSIIDPGHAATERPGMRALAELVAEVAGEADIEVLDLTALDPTPWR